MERYKLESDDLIVVGSEKNMVSKNNTEAAKKSDFMLQPKDMSRGRI